MHKHVLATPLFLLATLSTCAVHAAGQDENRFYAGLATGQSKSTLENGAGERFSSKNHPLPLKLYGGVALNDFLALEAGFAGATGKYEFDPRLYGTASAPRLSSRAVYLAAKGTVAVSDRLDLHAKLGVAHSRFEIGNAGAADRKLSGSKPMLGVGAAYRFTEKVAATLEFEHYGTVREKGNKLSQRQLQAGLRIGF